MAIGLHLLVSVSNPAALSWESFPQPCSQRATQQAHCALEAFSATMMHFDADRWFVLLGNNACATQIRFSSRCMTMLAIERRKCVRLFPALTQGGGDEQTATRTANRSRGNGRFRHVRAQDGSLCDQPPWRCVVAFICNLLPPCLLSSFQLLDTAHDARRFFLLHAHWAGRDIDATHSLRWWQQPRARSAPWL